MKSKHEGYSDIKTMTNVNNSASGVLLMVVAVVSFSLLAFEVILIRLLSVMLTYHYVFAVVSLALFGLGIGGIFVYLFRPEAPDGDAGSLAIDAGLYSLSMSLSSILVIQIGYVNSIRDNILVYCILLVIPFFFGGVFLAGAFRMFPAISGRIYGADLAGAAAGCTGVIFALNNLDIKSAILLLSAITSAAALVLAAAGRRSNLRAVIIAAAGFLTLSALLGASLFTSLLPDIPTGANREKEIYDALHGFRGKIVETKQSAFGRIDLVEYGNHPEWMDLYVDGTAGMPMYRFGGDFRDPGSAVASLKTDFPGYFPFMFLKENERKNALIVGPGGGRDILLAVMGGVQKVTAVEVNKDLVDLVRKYSWYNGGIYSGLKNVDVVVGEGRNFLKRNKEKYDVIMFSLPVTNTSRSLDGYALTENFLFTADAIIDYLEHLTEEGRLIVVTHNDFEVLRLLSISLASLDRRGTDNREAMKQIYITGSGDYPVFVLKKKPFEPAEASEMYKIAVRQLGYDPVSSYFPHVRQQGKLNPVLVSLETGQRDLSDLVNLVGKRGYDISPVTDQSPFFYKLNSGIPKPVILVLYSSLVLLLLVVSGPLLYRPNRGEVLFRGKKGPGGAGFSGRNKICFVSIFSMLGIGFMLVEITLIQWFMLFLGQPVLSVTVVLFSLLAGAGLGGFLSGRVRSAALFRGVAGAALVIVALLLVYNLLLPVLFDELLALNLSMRISAAVGLLLPLGLAMGFPFPLATRSLKELEMDSIIPWMLGINGISSVLGSVLTIVIAIKFGFTVAFLTGAACYLTLLLITKRIQYEE